MAHQVHIAAEHPGHQESSLEDTHATHHIVSPVVYLVIVVILFVLTYVTILCAYKDFGGLWNLVLALSIATIKATLVVLYFMHVKWSGRLIHITIGVSLMFFVLLIAGVLMDQYTRHNVVLIDEVPPIEKTQSH
ncbi:MAG: cytochrome C oxidase subunit IV family protein [Candidatus Sumerlaeaceae bacterium]